MLGKKSILLFTALLFKQLAMGQAHAWGGGADENNLSFGFSFQYVSQNYKIVKQPYWRRPYLDQELNKPLTDSLTSISSGKLPGFAVGFITRYRLGENLEARTTPALVFADRQVSYTYHTTAQNVAKQVQTTTIDVPLLLKLRSDRVGNLRAYVIGGAKYSFAVGKAENETNVSPLERKLKNKRGFASYEAGIGFDIYFEYFKMSPEIKLSNSMGNILVAENHPYADPISKLFLHSLMFSLHFE